MRTNKVVAVGAPGAGEIPSDGFVFVGRDAAADAISALVPGDDATLSYGLKDEIARQMQFTVGGNQPLVRVRRPSALSPRASPVRTRRHDRQRRLDRG